MNKIDISNRKEFRVGTLFNCDTTLNEPSKNNLKEGNIPYITRSSENNGLSGYCGNIDKINKGNCITIGAEGFFAFYQKNDFVAGNKVYTIRHSKINQYNAYFIISCLNILSSNYSFNNARILEKIKEEIIKLPIDEKGEPDREYMENYMKNVEEKCKNTINLFKLGNHINNINISGWKRFHLYDEGFFDIDSGTKLDKAKMKTDNPTINFVGRANANNGVTTTINEIKDLKPYPAGYMTLSLGGEYLGSCFIQNKPFYTSQNVIVLKPKWNMSENIKRFIGTMIFKEGRTYYKAFIDELNRHIKTDFSILLPIDSNNNPDRNYMENYIKNIMEKNKEKLNCLN